MLIDMLEDAVKDVLDGLSDGMGLSRTTGSSSSPAQATAASPASRLGLAASLAWAINALIRASSRHAKAVLSEGAWQEWVLRGPLGHMPLGTCERI